MLPPCSATMRAAMARPRPVPRSLVEKCGRKSLSLSSDEIHDHAAEQTPVGAHLRQIVGKGRLERNSIEPAGENLNRLMDDGVGIGGHQLGGREAHKLRKLV